ncbi:MAG: putative motility protein [Firmicutes bacterium]|nr:putative motility protein [Bacillota bacterium]
MVMNIASLASSLKAQEIRLAVGTRLAGMAKDVMEEQGADLLKLIESAKQMELSVNPHLGSLLDVEA